MLLDAIGDLISWGAGALTLLLSVGLTVVVIVDTIDKRKY